MQMMEHIQTQFTEHVLTRPGHEEERHASNEGTEHEQPNDDQNESEQTCDALVIRHGSHVRGRWIIVPGVGFVDQLTGPCQ